ncbi:MAG: uroporphyrinogen-III synthase [Nitrososphaerota archaeon]|nr:uroporphyrinogen-III synthase [Nitrososphaerota archaeon]
MNSSGLYENTVEKHQPLAGRTVIVTRTDKGNESLRKMLELRGAKVIECPAVRIAPPESWEKVDEAIMELADFDWVVFTSSNGVRTFLERLLSTNRKRILEIVRSAQEPLFACVGPSTAKTLESYGLKCSLLPDTYLTERLAASLAPKVNRESKILLARSEIANKEMSRVLRTTGAIISDLVVYRTLSHESYGPEDLPQTATDIIFASPSAVRAFSNPKTVDKIISERLSVHCIGPVTAKAAADFGIDVTTVSQVHTTNGLVEAMIVHMESVSRKVN